MFFHLWGQTFLMEQATLGDYAAARVRGILDFAQQQQKALLKIVPSADLAVELYPNPTSDTWKIVPTNNWTSGFFPACLWLNYQERALLPWKIEGERRLAQLEKEKDRKTTHDLGFMVGLPFSLAYDITGEASYRDVVIAAAGSLMTRFNPSVGATRSWNGGNWSSGDNFTVIIDNMMNLELLLRASRFPGGDPAWQEAALRHARTSIREHLRPDGSTIHVVVFNRDTGAVKWKQTHQGYANESTWSRGQAWALYGFAMVYEFTGETDMLETAVKLADYFVDRLPESGAVPWDFDAPGPEIPTDTSASSIAAAGLLRLASTLPDDDPLAGRYRDAASKILIGLSLRPFLAIDADYGALLKGGSRAKNEYNQSLIYGDYYLLEASHRLLGSFPSMR